MNEKNLTDLLEKVRDHRMDLETAVSHLKRLPFEDLGFAKVDTHRAVRTGFPEVIFGQGKTVDQICKIAESLAARSENILATRCDRNVYDEMICRGMTCRYHEAARIIVVNPAETKPVGSVTVISAGTADMPVAEEAAVTAETLGNRVTRIYDAGVAGIHRLLEYATQLQRSRAIVVAAGMEGALPSVVGGLVACPVIAVPTSVGYGASFNGLAALLGMLNSCASGVSVVNIDNGFGAGFQASLINQLDRLTAGSES